MIMMTCAEKLEALRACMKDIGLQGYIIPKADEYQGEYVPAAADRLAWLSGFTGSAGAAIVLEKNAVVASDGRYTIQLADEVDSACFAVADSTVISIGELLASHARAGAVIGYDPMLFTPAQIDKVVRALEGTKIALKSVPENLIDVIWQTGRPQHPASLVEAFPHHIAGQTPQAKAEKIAAHLRTCGARAVFISAPDSVAWLLNIRGADLPYVPLALSRALVYDDGQIDWFIDSARVSAAVKAHIGAHVSVVCPDRVHAVLLAMAGQVVQFDDKSVPIGFVEARLGHGTEYILYDKDPCALPRACKTPPEQDSIRRAHVTDAVAVVSLLHWLSQQIEQGANLSELDVVAKLETCRRQSPAYRHASFDTIAGFGSNGAIVHYRPAARTNKTLEAGNLLLLDSGGQYAGGGTDIYGTTDITRTVAIGMPTREMQENFTRVLKGHIAVSCARFDAARIGSEIDMLARAPLREAGLDFAHGTGHGVGCYLSVHEEASSLSPRGKDVLQPGMVLSNEPGYYKTGAYGIRTENLVMVRNDYSFETLTLVPYDRNLIAQEMLSPQERAWINAYHARVFSTLIPLLEQRGQAACLDWLRAQTEPLL